jgi:hypothetical protein
MRQVLRKVSLGVKMVPSGGFSDTRLAVMQSVYEPEAMAVVGVATGVSVATVTGSVGGVAEGEEGASEVGVACACTVRATDVAMMDSLSAEGSHALSRRLTASRREIGRKVRFILFLSTWPCKGMPS